jgi:Ca2+-binding RTX toxin-like protein
MAITVTRVPYGPDLRGTTSTLQGDGADDDIVGYFDTELIKGGGGNDTLSGPAHIYDGEAGDDLLRGRSDNVFQGGPGNDTLEGGGGLNFATFFGAPGPLTVDLGIAGPQQTGHGIDVLINIRGVSDGDFADTLTGDAQDNLFDTSGGDDVVYGLAGDDTIRDLGFAFYDQGRPTGATTRNTLRGGEGDDTVTGGEDFDDINGNQGEDVVSGGAGGDWVLGGQGNDVVHGGYVDNYEDANLRDGADLLNGNLGNDTCDGGSGADTVRGGQGDDSLTGGQGEDALYGDLGDDMLSGGQGADRFHLSGEAGVDRVTDFDFGAGDRVVVDAGARYAAAQVGADTVVTLADGAQMILQGVRLPDLGGGWIVEGG